MRRRFLLVVLMLVIVLLFVAMFFSRPTATEQGLSTLTSLSETTSSTVDPRPVITLPPIVGTSTTTTRHTHVTTRASRSRSISRPGGCGGWGNLVSQYSWNVTTACRILMCESRGNPNAKNAHSSATGLFQILHGPTDPAANVALAFSMYSKRGWQPWVCK